MNDTIINHQEREHARVSPSSLKRILACPSSLLLNEGVEKPVSKAAIQGTIAHEVCEYYLRRSFNLPVDTQLKDIKNKTSKHLECAVKYTEFANMIKADLQKTTKGNVEVLVESKVSLEALIPECWGTADVIFISSTKLAVLDYKYGQVKVDVDKNEQLQAYALGAYLELPKEARERIRSVDMYIYQPNVEKPYSKTSYSVDSLLSWAKEAKPIVKEALEGTTKAKAGDHCMFCAVKDSCHTRKESLERKNDFADANVDFDRMFLNR